ncbi:MAG TPA: FecR domain-containing protein [Thermoanaerobaculaceae bacterium]|nr:FecR domain-containing protein [Thermoanaerobaculaceae bacterium]
MSRHHERHRDEAPAQAAYWVARLAAEDASASDRAEFQEWLALSPEHHRAYQEAERTWSDLDALSGLAGSDPGVLPETLRDEIGRYGAEANASLARASRRFRARSAALIAAAVVIGVVGLAWIGHLKSRGATGTQVIASELRTRVGERSQTMLADGSVVYLNTDTEVQVALSTARRSVHLVSGEAYFEVAKDAHRPFVVSVADRTITAVGTAFDVYNRGGETRVTVIEGTVEVSRHPPLVIKPAPAPKKPAARQTGTLPGPVVQDQPQKVTATQTARLLDTETAITPLPLPLVAQQASWRQGRLYFDAVTLKDMVEQLRPYVSARIVIADPSIEGFVGGAVVHVESAESILTAISLAWPVEVKRESPDLIVLTRRR